MSEKEKKIKILYASDDNYAGVLGVSMLSLLENNKKSNIDIYILENHISAGKKNMLQKLTDKFVNSNLFFIDAIDVERHTQKKLLNDRSLSMYSRLFIQDCLPNDVNRILYLDCDTLILGSLNKLFFHDMGSYTLSACRDLVSVYYKKMVGLKKNSVYINSGVLLIDLERWRKRKTESRFIGYIKKYNGNVPHHDQGIINGVLLNEIEVIPIKYNAITPIFEFSYKHMCKLFKCNHISEKEKLEAEREPVCIHFTPSYSGRPWMKYSSHPMKKVYKHYADKANIEMYLNFEDKRTIYIKLLMFIYSKLPFLYLELLQKFSLSFQFIKLNIIRKLW